MKTIFIALMAGFLTLGTLNSWAQEGHGGGRAGGGSRGGGVSRGAAGRGYYGRNGGNFYRYGGGRYRYGGGYYFFDPFFPGFGYPYYYGAGYGYDEPGFGPYGYPSAYNGGVYDGRVNDETAPGRGRYQPGAFASAVQRALKDKGYYHGKIDGQFGPGSTRALRDYQRDKRLPVTGRIDQRTLEALGFERQ